jgi:hypothetical protein
VFFEEFYLSSFLFLRARPAPNKAMAPTVEVAAMIEPPQPPFFSSPEEEVPSKVEELLLEVSAEVLLEVSVEEEVLEEPVEDVSPPDCLPGVWLMEKDMESFGMLIANKPVEAS